MLFRSSIERFNESVSHEFLWSLDAVEVLEFDGTIVDSVWTIPPEIEVSPALKAFRFVVGRAEYKRILELLAIALKQRMMERNPLTTTTACSGRRRMDRGLRVD